jgi:uncharacterized protein (TIGR00299 family) protein
LSRRDLAPGMRTLAFDGRMGASGDMVLGALLAAGADRSALTPVEDVLDVRYVAESVVKNGIDATSAAVVLAGEEGGDRAGDDQAHDHTHDRDREHARDEAGRTPAEGHGPVRSYGEVLDIVESMGLPPGVEADATAIFGLLGEAEAAVHGSDIEAVHFHEVGADDAIADVVGTALLLEDLGIERVVTTPLSAGGGEVEMSHGTYPVPTPAVVELAEHAGWSLCGGPVDAELLTPTGAAILAHFADGVESVPALRVEASGYGAGGWEFERRPNVLRATVGQSTEGLDRDAITVLETNLDDAAPELLGGLQETLADAGALDVAIVPMTMKKSRPGHLVKVVCRPERARQVARRLAEETGTLGIREHGAGHRWIADREQRTATVTVDDRAFEVAVKVASADGEVYDVSAEFDDALAVTRETDRPVREVMRRAEAAVREK